MPSTRPVCAEPSISSSACLETSSSSGAFSRTCVYLDWATTGSFRNLYMELMSKAPFAALADGEHYHQPRSSVLGCSSWGRIRRRRAISINAARTILPLWQLTHDGCLEVVENPHTRLRNDILNSNDGEPTPTDSKTFCDSLPQQLEELGSNSSRFAEQNRDSDEKIKLLVWQDYWSACALSLLLFQTLHRNATRAQPFFRNCQSQPRPVYT